MITTWTELDILNKPHYQRNGDIVHRAADKRERAWDKRNAEVEAMLAAGKMDYELIAELDEMCRIVEWWYALVYAHHNECTCREDRAQACPVCRARIAAQGDEIPFSEKG